MMEHFFGLMCLALLVTNIVSLALINRLRDQLSGRSGYVETIKDEEIRRLKQIIRNDEVWKYRDEFEEADREDGLA